MFFWTLTIMSRDIDELYWAAFRYTADEMSADESAEFEKRLEAEQPAREAVARVVELSQVVRTVSAETPMPADSFTEPAALPGSMSEQPAARPVVVRAQTGNWMRPIGWMAVGVAACLAVIMVLDKVGPRLAPPTAVMIASSGADASDALAQAWLRTHDAVYASELEGDSLTGERQFAAFDDDAMASDTFGRDVTTTDSRAPGWMIAAVSATSVHDVPVEN
jgi:hypothetical protein